MSLLAVGSTAWARPRLDANRMSRLAQYDVLTFSDPFQNGLMMGKAIAVFDATPEEVFRVATDYARWHEYLPRVQSSQVMDHTRDGATVEITIELPWPVGRTAVTARYQHQKYKGEIYVVRFNKVRGNMKQYLGTLYIEPWAPGKSAVTYQLVAQPDMLAPKGMVNRAVQKSASGFVNALRQRVNDLHQLGLLHPEPLPMRKARSPLLGRAPRQGATRADADR